MFVTIRKYAGCTNAREVNRIVQVELLPVLRELPGFRSYVVVDPGDQSVVSIGMFESKDAAESANHQAREIVQKSLANLLPNSPEITMGEVLAEAK